MKQIINGKLYNTNTASAIADNEHLGAGSQRRADASAGGIRVW
jgi:hypothetical protein